MEEKQITDLVAYLVTLGFKGGKLEDDLRKEISFNLPSFKVNHHIPWGEEQMFFELQFNKDQQFGAYRLVEYKAIHRREVDIEHAVVEDIDTRELEEAMKKIKWLEYFDKGREVTDVFSKQLIELTMPKLIRISYGDSATGRRIQQELMFKYWPNDVYKAHITPAEGDLSRGYEEERIFPATEYGTCHANLAFHLLSGRLEELYEQLYPFEIDAYLGKDLHSYLEDRLSGNPEKFNITCNGNEPEGFIEFVIPVESINGWYWNSGYTATLTMHPEISHRSIGNIDSAALEEKMKEINWKDNGELFVFHEDREPDFTPKVCEIDDQLRQLSQDPAGAEIADRLKIKYWQGVTFFDDLIPQSAINLLDSLPKREQTFKMEVPLKAAYNLLCGRAILQEVMNKIQISSGEWVRLNLDEEEKGKDYPIVKMKGYFRRDMEQALDMLPLSNHKGYYIRQLGQGEITTAALQNGVELKLQADPERKSLKLFTTDMQPVSFNFNLDPNWEPEETNQRISGKKKSQAKQNTQQISQKKRHKGKSL